MPDKNIPLSKNCKVFVKYKDNTTNILEANYIFYNTENGVVEVWKGENHLVGLFNISDIIGVCMTEQIKGG